MAYNSYFIWGSVILFIGFLLLLAGIGVFISAGMATGAVYGLLGVGFFMFVLGFILMLYGASVSSVVINPTVSVIPLDPVTCC